MYRQVTIIHTHASPLALPHTFTPTCSRSRPGFSFQLGYCTALQLCSFYNHNTVPLPPLICSCLTKHTHTNSISYSNMVSSVFEVRKNVQSQQILQYEQELRENMSLSVYRSRRPSVCLCFLPSSPSLSLLSAPSFLMYTGRKLLAEYLPSLRSIRCFERVCAHTLICLISCCF